MLRAQFSEHRAPSPRNPARDQIGTPREITSESALARIPAARGETPDREAIDSEALFAWSSLHGVVSLLRTDAMGTLDLAPGARDAFVMQALQRIGAGLGMAGNTQGEGA